ncbi:MAG: hypothetical protein HY898_28100 [Deltaproteobacteria bacterium]|nr:hypothetical protein [Deltaproteobacteria bacterium]
MKWAAAAAAMAALAGVATSAHAAGPIPVDRVAARFEASELGGPARPRFIFERELAFEARVEALAEKKRGFALGGAYEDRHLRAALERHVTEEILQSLPIEPAVSSDDIRRRAVTATLVLEQRVDGRENLLEAATAEGLEEGDLQVIVRRQARASLYLDRMVAPMLNPSDAELLEVLRSEPTPYRGRPFDQVATPLRHWYVEERLVSALAAFFQGARARIRIVIIGRE